MDYAAAKGAKMRKIGIADLIEAGACSSQVETFRELFPAGVVPTLELCLRHAGTFDWDWAEKLLPSRGWAAYKAARDPAWSQTLAAYEAARAQAWVACEEARDQAWVAYKAAAARAWFEQWSYEEAGHDT